MANREAVAAVVSWGDLVLVGKKNKTEGKWFSGRWHLPGETLNQGESDQDGLIRGIQEEVGIEIAVIGYLAEHTSPRGAHVKWYCCKAITFNLKPGSDLETAEWIPKNQVPNRCGDEVVSLWPKEIKRFFFHVFVT